MLIQILLIAAVMLVGVFLMRRQTERYQAIRRILLGLFVLAAIACILYPNALTVVARWVHVGRGTDLLLYALIVAFLGYVVSSYSRERRMQERLTVLARRIAIAEAGDPVPGDAVPGDAARGDAARGDAAPIAPPAPAQETEADAAAPRLQPGRATGTDTQ